METNNNNLSYSSQKEVETVFAARDLWGLVIGHWPWFLLSLALAMLVATYYVVTTVPVYTRSASVLIKEDQKSGSIAGDLSKQFSDMGLGMTKVNVNNEIVNFQSPDLALQVAKNLNLDVNYQVKGATYMHTLYGSSLPVKVQFLDTDASKNSRMVLTMHDSKAVLSGFASANILEGTEVKPVEAAYGDTVSTPVGPVVVTRSQYSDVAYDKPIIVSRSSYQAAASGCRGKLTAALNGKQTTVIDLGYRDVNTQRAEDVLQMVINVYNENWIKDKNQITTSTNQFIADRLRIIEQELGSVDKTITDYRSTHRIPDAGAAAQLDMQLSAEASKHLLELRNQLSIARFLQNDIRGASPGALLPANVGLNDSSTSAQITEFNSTMLQRNRLVENSSEDNLLVIDLNKQLSSMRTAILTSLDNYIKSIEIQIQSSQAARQSSEARVSDIPIQAGQLLSDERQQKVKEALYLFLLQKREENELSQAFTAYNTRVVASPNGPNQPISPKKAMIYLVAIVLGLALPFAFFYIRELMNTTVRGRKDLESISAPFLGELPATTATHRYFSKQRISDKAEDRKIVVKPHSRDMVNEAFRVIRTNLEFMKGKEKDIKVMMVTSFNVGAGKTFVASNLATALAIRGRKTIIVDLDLRKRSLSALVGQPEEGVSGYLGGLINDWRSLLVQGLGDSPVDVLPVGKMPPNPAELLGETRLNTLIQELKENYDYVMLDCPPVELVTDSDLIAPYADITMFIIRAGLMERIMLPEVERYYKEKKYNNMALLLNGTEATGRYGYKYGYRYGYRYGYSYGYGRYGSYGAYSYGYGAEDDADKKSSKKAGSKSKGA